MASITLGQGRLNSNSWAKCPLPLAMSLPSSVQITKKGWEKGAKNVISDPKNGCHFQRSRSFEVKFTDKVPLTSSKCRYQVFVWITRKYLEKVQKLLSQALKMAAIFRGQSRLRSNTGTRCSLHLAMSLPSFVQITAKMWFHTLKMEKCKNMISYP